MAGQLNTINSNKKMANQFSIKNTTGTKQTLWCHIHLHKKRIVCIIIYVIWQYAKIKWQHNHFMSGEISGLEVNLASKELWWLCRVISLSDECVFLQLGTVSSEITNLIYKIEPTCLYSMWFDDTTCTICKFSCVLSAESFTGKEKF